MADSAHSLFELFFVGAAGAGAVQVFQYLRESTALKVEEGKSYKRSAAIVASELEIFSLKCTDLRDSIEYDGIQNPDIPEMPPISALVDLSLFEPSLLSRYLSLNLYQKSAQTAVNYIRFRGEMADFSPSNIDKQLTGLGFFSLNLARDLRRDAGLPRMCIPKNIWDFAKNLKIDHQEIVDQEN